LKIRIEKYTKQIALILVDIVFVYAAVFIAILLRLEGNIPVHYRELAVIHGAFYAAVFIVLFFVFGLYNSLWEYAGSKEVLKISAACITGTFIITFIEFVIPERLPLSVPAIACLALILFIGGTRMAYRITRRISKKRYRIFPVRNSSEKRTMVVGAGDAGSIIIREMLFNPGLNNIPVVAVDDDRKKHGKTIYGIRIEGGCGRIPNLAKKYDIREIIFAIPAVSRKDRKKILNICSQTGCSLKMMPLVSELEDYYNFKEKLRPVKVEDLLGRDEVDLDVRSIAGYLSGKTVLITGGGGSIGSEIARQVIKYKPGKLIILDVYENTAYRLVNELKRKYIDIDIDIVIASIRDTKRLEQVFDHYRPDVVFHAAAHKHVPLMEACPCEAIKNNVLGTLNTAKAADKYRVNRFVLISTDKAVNPANIMGASKRVAEMIIQSINKISETEFMAVRFGNVLGSNGSVIPLFEKQIEEGGPVTVTHPDIRRYFMTIPEAAKLVIQSGAMAKGGEIFVLDMGELIKIMDLAKNLISLSGFIPDEDIKIEIIGLRPGEKMFEEMMMDEEGIKKTYHEKIFIGKSNDILYKDIIMKIELLKSSLDDPESLRETMAKIVPTYTYKKEGIDRIDDLEKHILPST